MEWNKVFWDSQLGKGCFPQIHAVTRSVEHIVRNSGSPSCWEKHSYNVKFRKQAENTQTEICVFKARTNDMQKLQMCISF